jgi:hypothetical protein
MDKELKQTQSMVRPNYILQKNIGDKLLYTFLSIFIKVVINIVSFLEDSTFTAAKTELIVDNDRDELWP